jgi:hypothetical protein
MDPSLSADVTALLRDRIRTFEALEVLLLVRQRPDQAWTPALLSERMRIPVGAAADALDELCRSNLLDVRVGRDELVFRYNPGTHSLDASVARLAEAYDQARVEVVRFLGTVSAAHERTRAIRSFADAFLLGRRKKKDG